MASNASLIVTKRNDNKGRIYQVGTAKAFKLVHDEEEVMTDERASFDFNEQEAEKARRICKCPHFSFLCQELGLPCSASALITSFVVEHQPYIFAEPGDIWIDICLTTPARTYVLARRTSEVVALSQVKLQISANNMLLDFLDSLDQGELLTSMDKLLGTPNAGKTVAEIAFDHGVGLTGEISDNLIEMVSILYMNGKVSKSDVKAAMADIYELIDPFVPDDPRNYDYAGKLFATFHHLDALDVAWLCDSTNWASDSVIHAVMRNMNFMYGGEAVQSCFGGLSERGSLEQLLGQDEFQEIANEFLPI